ncbi:hypothetical protein PMIN02_007009 [Paraphaeosphaeria minitans]
MSAGKRPASDPGSAKRPAKRARPLPLPESHFHFQPPSHDQTAQVSGLRPVQPSANHEVIYISSASPDGTDDVSPPPHMKPSGGIAPSDSLQDEPVNSIESASRSRNPRTGLEHYLYITKKKAKDYAVVTGHFDSYRRATPPNDPVGDPLPDVQPQTLNLGLQDPKYDYGQLPAYDMQYAKSIYKAQTWNPLIALAIIRIAEKNLAFLDFDYTLAHLPNVGPRTFAPEFPHVEDGQPMPFLDAATRWMTEEGDQPITVVFLPEFYQDGRHALAFWTRKKSSGRLCSIVCTPCTTQELRAAGFLALVPAEHGLPEDPSPQQNLADIRQWSNFRIGVGGGDWLYPGLERDLISWERAEHVVGFELELRVAITTYPRYGVSEDGPIAQKRDNGLWYDTRWE